MAVDPATAVAVVSFTAALFGGEERDFFAPQKEALQRATQISFARAQLGVTTETIESRQRRDLAQLSFEERQEAILTRLNKVTIRRQASISAARQRSAAQQARIGGVGGSLAGVRTGAAEIRTEVAAQLLKLETDRQIREEVRTLKKESVAEETQLGIKQAQLSAAGSIFNVQSTPTAVVDTSGQRLQQLTTATTQLLSTPQVATAISGFFNPQ